jgi:Resolvase, N terminal domain
MLADAKHHKFDIVVVARYDRFSRVQDQQSVAIYMQERYGVSVVSATQPVAQDHSVQHSATSMLSEPSSNSRTSASAPMAGSGRVYETASFLIIPARCTAISSRT